MSIDIHSCHLLLEQIQFTLIHGSTVPGYYAILFFTESDFTFTTGRIHNQVSFTLWPSHFILSGAISLLFPSSILDTYRPGRLIFWCHIILPFHTVHVVLKAAIQKCFAIRFSSEPCFVRTLHLMTRLFWVALHGMAHSFIESCKPLCHDKAVIHEGEKQIY